MQPGAGARGSLRVYLSYASAERSWSERIAQRVRIAARGAGLEPPVIVGPGQILAGSDTRRARRAALESADLILLLVSPDFFENPDCLDDQEVALARRDEGVIVVPIIVRPVGWKYTELGRLEALPPGHPLSRSRDEGLYLVEEGLRRLISELRGRRQKAAGASQLLPQQEQALRAMLIDHQPFIASRLEGFVGRGVELAALRQQIAELQPGGGYLIISAQAGQGKSSLIARLVQEEGAERVPHHFLPLDPPLDHVVALLRDLLARLIFAQALDPTPLLVAGTSRAALTTAFWNLLNELGSRGERVLICIDGLDQLPRDPSGRRDLSFLPTQLPAGCVLVLGSRPDDLLPALHQRGPVREYRLPPLSRADFDQLLRERGLQLTRAEGDRLYAFMEQNTLYLDLAARALERDPALTADALRERLSSDPANIFSLSIDRLKPHPLWEHAIYPLLGLLLVAREALGQGQLSQILAPLPTYQVRDALQQLGGLLIADGGGRYSLFHPKLRDYLRQDPEQPASPYLFSAAEEAHWHRVLADWCERGGSELIWQEARHDPDEAARRRYARQHLAAHLFYGRAWERLFALLDAGHYGQSKIRQLDPSTRAYASDLDLGRQAAAWEGWSFSEGLAQLPRLWHYTLLRCSLSSQAERYPPEAFALLVQLGRQQEAIGLADLISDPGRQIEALVAIARQLQEQGAPESDYGPLYWRACDVARQSSEPERLAPLLSELARDLYRAGCTEPALQLWWAALSVARRAVPADLCAEALQQIAEGLAEAGQSAEIEEIIEAMPPNTLQDEARLTLVEALARARRWTEASEVVEAISESAVQQRAEALAVLGSELAQAGEQERAQQLWQQAERLALTISGGRQQAKALLGLVRALARAQQWSEAERICELVPDQWRRGEAWLELVRACAAGGRWREAEASSERLEDERQQAEARQHLAEALAAAGRWQEAEGHSLRIPLPRERLHTLTRLGLARAARGQLREAQRLWQQAEAELERLESGDEQCVACVQLGQALARAGLHEEAQRCWRQAEAIIRTLPEGEERREALAPLIERLIQLGRWQEAERLATTLGDWQQQAQVLIARGRDLSQSGRRAEAEQRWRQIVGLVRKQPASREQIQAALTLVSAFASPATWDEAERWVRSLVQGQERGEVLAYLGRLQALAGARERARRLWQEAEALIAGEASSWEQSDGYQALARELAQAGEWEEAARIVECVPEGWERADGQVLLVNELVKAGRLDEAERCCRAIELEHQRVQALLILGKGHARAAESEPERRARAEECWSESERLIAGMWAEQRAELLAALGEALAAAGERERARQYWRQSEQQIAALEGEGGKAEALAVLAETLIAAQEWGEAERLLKHYPYSQRASELLARLVASLAEAGHWEEAQRISKAISLDQERARALAVLGRVLAQAGQRERAHQIWAEGRQLIGGIISEEGQAQVLLALGQALAEAGEAEELLRLVQQEWSRVGTRVQALRLFPLVGNLIGRSPELGSALGEAFVQVERFLSGAGT
ncbi:MAG: NACHT domain-containing protein [Thermogemmatispora sp.]|uniref:NACHT domain-containing protein n=1 Tax=Thermogemmatispora sp. TaxID=1968838 RepID=UPI00261FE897|nr:NACHT domain-containing protein [Thermogemmatispora sp.]MBX5459054.1 NACHT domain-containing protein [Thermogemmatispora sp.]